MNKKVTSVIIPAYNASKYISETINSILRQTYKNIEIIVVDDGSTDDTENVLQNYINSGEIIYIKKENGGPASARNVGIKNSHGNLIAFCDADDIWLPEKLEKQVELHNSYTEPIVTFTKRYLYFDKTSELKCADEKLYAGNIYCQLLIVNFVSNSSVVIDKRIISQLGFLNEDKKMIAVEDYEYWLRIAKKFNFYFVDDFLFKYRVYEEQISRIENRYKVTRVYWGEVKRNLFTKYFKFSIHLFIHNLWHTAPIPLPIFWGVEKLKYWTKRVYRKFCN